ncbi:uncharacterized protein CHAB577_0028 [Chlamydia abortus]|nr:uncharacterized protein CHAB577_0028 [Chlamydia abortus]
MLEFFCVMFVCSSLAITVRRVFLNTGMVCYAMQPIEISALLSENLPDYDISFSQSR